MATLVTWYYKCSVCGEEVTAGARLPHADRHRQGGEGEAWFDFTRTESERYKKDEIGRAIADRAAQDEKGEGAKVEA